MKSLIASISRAFPVGGLMSLDMGGPVNFKPRPVEMLVRHVHAFRNMMIRFGIDPQII